ncbi:MAG: VOC family protein [Hyphomicrobiaceae bacterium]|nr:VOC family protein [Hyphomicrobiaceae bacterium]
MPIPSVTGLDHVVVVARDLDHAEAQWRRLGFTISPRGVHSAHMGTANHTIMLGEDYLELMGVLTATERNAPMREMLARTEGIDRAAFTTLDAQLGVDALKARGLTDSIGPIGFSRPVKLADGRMTEAKFDTFQWPLSERPGGLRIFACQHHSRDAVWLPELTTHANGALRIRHIEMLSTDPKGSAEHMSRLIEQPVARHADGAYVVVSGGTRGAFHFVDQAMFVARHRGVPLDGLSTAGGAALSLGCRSLDETSAALDALGVGPTASSVSVAPANANGVVVEFVVD